MDDFTKQKIAFAIGLLAVLFTVTPLLQPFGELGYYLFGVKLTFLRLYYTLTLILALSIYFYAIQFLTERDLRYPAIIGNLLYAVALVLPVLYAALFVVTYGVGLLRPVFSNPIAQTVITAVIGSIVGGFGADVVRRLGQALGRQEKKAVSEQLEREEMQFFHRAEQFLQTGYYDLAVVEAWKAIEVAARGALLRRDVRVSYRLPIHREIEMHGLLPKDLIPALEVVRRTRNTAAHAVERISEEQARSAIELSARILAALTPVDDDSGEA